MARMALTLGVTAAGAVVGGYFGNPMLGAQLGMMVGSIAGALLFPGGEDQKGPRLGDLRVGDASYGVPIPIVYGTARVAGNMIWTSGLEERSNEESLKGGGPTSTTYTYYSSFAMGLCEGPLASVRKIWLDTKLVYDMSSSNLGIVNQRVGELDPRGDLSAEELAERRDEIQAQLHKVQSALTIYLGTETQLPDPEMEAREGVGQVPAHRGLAYLLFADLPLEAYGNRIPNVSAEVMTQTALAYPKVTVNPGVTIGKDMMVLDQARQTLWSLHGQTLQQVDALSNTLLRTGTIDTSLAGGTPVAGTAVWNLAVDVDGFLYVSIQGPTQSSGRLARIDPVSFAVTHVNENIFTALPEALQPAWTLAVSQQYCWVTTTGLFIQAYCFFRPGAINPQNGLPIVDMTLTGAISYDGALTGLKGQMIAIDRDETAWIVATGTVLLFRPQTVLIHMTPLGVYDVIDLSADLLGGSMVAYDALTHSLILGGYANVSDFTTRVVRFDIATRTVTGMADGLINTAYYQSAWHQGIQGRRLWFPHGNSQMRALDVDTLTLVRVEDTGAPDVGWPTGTFFGGLYDAATHAMWVAESGVGFAKYYFDRVEPQGLALGAIVADVSRRAGLHDADVVTAELTAPVHGYVLSQRAEARSALEPLLQAFLVDGVERDWCLTFGHRALQPVATLTTADLAAHEPGATLPDVLTPERLDDQQLPIRLDVTYPDPARDYQDTVQHARRFQAGQRARSQREVRTPVILSADQAKQLAEQSLSEAWVSRTQYRLTLPYHWTTLDPGDVLAVEALGSTQVLRVQQIQNGANGILECSAVAYDAHIYTASMSVGVVADAPPAPSLMMDAPTGLFLLDTHLLRDIDDSAGFYVAVTPQGSGAWHGATVFSSSDGSAWHMEETLTTAVAYGSAQSVLAPGSPYVIDTGHTVDVTMARGTPTSISEAELINGYNGGLLGNEIVQWQTATPLGPNLWRLSSLLRGRRGTEWAIAGHQVGERFLLLSPATLRRQQMGLSEVDTTRLYRAVTMNTDALTTTGQAFRNTALGLKPYSPDHLHGTRNPAQDLTIAWVRRTRLGGLWIDNRDVALGESQEQYEIDIIRGGVVVRTLTSTTPSVTYPTSQQVADGGTAGAPVTVSVYQLGQLGRGWGATATL